MMSKVNYLSRSAAILRNPLFVAACAACLTLAAVHVIQTIHHDHAPQSQLHTVIAKVGKLMYLPTNETPALATVVNPAQLQGNLQNIAKKGDDVLVYEKNSELIVYRPSSGKIVTVEPVLMGSQPNPNLTISIAVLNGSGDPNNMQSFISNLYKMFPNLQLVYKDNAPRSFPSTIVFGQQAGDSLAEQVGKSLGIQTGQDPLGIPGNLARLTFIIGQNYE